MQSQENPLSTAAWDPKPKPNIAFRAGGVAQQQSNCLGCVRLGFNLWSYTLTCTQTYVCGCVKKEKKYPNWQYNGKIVHALHAADLSSITGYRSPATN